MSKADPAPVFAALGDRTRLKLLMTLSDGATRSIVCLSFDAGMTRQAVTKHLRVLEGAGLVECAREGRESRFTVRPASLVVVRDYLDAVSRHWDDTLARLKAHVEDKD